MMVVESIVTAISRLVAAGSPRDLTLELARLEAAGALEDEALYPQPCEEHYARKLLWQDPAGAFIVIGFTWGPGQATELHDHAGFWGAEIVVSGTMEETTYELKERSGEAHYRFARGRTRTSEKGAIGVIEPPKEYHVFGNPGGPIARTLHVYGGNLVRCRFFSPDSGEWWNARAVDLEYDG